MVDWKAYLGPVSWLTAGLCALVTVLAMVEGRPLWIVVFGTATVALFARQWGARKQA